MNSRSKSKDDLIIFPKKQHTPASVYIYTPDVIHVLWISWDVIECIYNGSTSSQYESATRIEFKNLIMRGHLYALPDGLYLTSLCSDEYHNLYPYTSELAALSGGGNYWLDHSEWRRRLNASKTRYEDERCLSSLSSCTKYTNYKNSLSQFLYQNYGLGIPKPLIAIILTYMFQVNYSNLKI